MSVDKYDRQTRLWGEGQLLICDSRILCLNIDGAATEVLKNLILAGTGFVALVDNKKIDQQDLKENFFVNSGDIGKNRAEVCLKNLLELNPDVKGTFYDISPEEFLGESQLEISTYDVIIVTNKQDNFNNKVISLAEKNSQRVILIRNFGLINYFRIYENYHGSFQLRLPDNPITDLRIANPFEELKSFCASIDIDSINDEMKHQHIPYIVILIQALEKFRLKYENLKMNPSNSTEKNELKSIINSMRKFKDEENFNEAMNFYYFANKDKCNLITPELAEVFEILDENSLESLLKKTNRIMSNFFVICKALQNFYRKYNTLPVVGSLPDMTSDTESKEDREIMRKLVQEVIHSINNDSLSLKKQQILSTISNDDYINHVDILSKNWPQVHLLHYPTITEEEKGTHYKDNDLDENHHKINFIWYLLIKAADLFYEKKGRYPGENLSHDLFQEDAEALRQVLFEYLEENNKKDKLPFDIEQVEILNQLRECIYEFCRMSNSKVVPAISIISSIASQEIIKLITYQFKTINNTVIFDGIHSTLSTFKF